MTFPPPPPSAQSSIASGTDKSSSSRSARSQQPAWGSSAPQSSVRRGLTPLATNNLSSSSTAAATSRRPPQSSSPGPGISTTSPLTTSFSAVLSSSSRLPGSRNAPSPASTPSPFPSLQPGSQQHQQPGQSLSSPKSRALTPSSGSHLASTAGSVAGGGGSGGGGGGTGSSRGVAFSPLSGTTVNSPTGFSSDKPTSGSAGAGTSSNQSSLTKISVAQVFLLLDSITEKEGKEKWETKAAQIQKLVESNGMEVFSKYFRRLLTGNAPQIFPGTNKVAENAGNYPLLVQEMQKVSQDLDQAQKIAETIDTSEGDVFRDFDLSTFLEHFKLDPLVKVALALAFKTANKSDLRAKADAILSNTTPQFLQSLATPSETNKDFNPSFIGLTIERFILYPPRNFNEDIKTKLIYAASLRYQKLGVDIPSEISSALQMFNFLNPRLVIVRQLHSKGPKATSSQDAVNEVMNSAGSDSWSEEHVANALLFMVLSQYSRQYSLETFLKAVQAHYADKRINWALLLRQFDREGLRINAEQFSRLYSVFLNAASDDSTLDVQRLWGGDWEHRDTQVSFLTALISSQVDISQIPNLRETFPADLFADGPETVRLQGESAVKSPLRSLDAMRAIFDLALFSQAAWATTEAQLLIKAVVQHGLPVFLCSALALPQPWTSVQQSFVLRTLVVFILKQEEGYQLALHGVWKQDRQWLAEQLFTTFTQDPTSTAAIYEHAVEYGWLDYLLGFTNGLALDLASLAHRKGSFDLEQWVRNAAQKGPMDMGSLLSKFLRIKAEDELRVQRKEQPAPQMVSLAVKTVHTLLSILEDYVGDRESLTPVQRICIQTYPRLINYGEGFDDIIDANGENGNALPEAIDKQMQELFGKMYHEELSLREILELMRRYKTSRDPAEQDLFACMVHGLIDEYHCYHEYPLEALSKTAVMFGGIINFRLIDGIPLKVGLGMILEAVRDHEPHDPMYKFGVEAIEQLMSRLAEWAGFCHLLLQVPTLHGTSISQKAEEVLQEQGNQAASEAEAARLNGVSDGQTLTNGNAEADGSPRKFRSLHVDPPLRPDIYKDPDEEVQDKILFVLNNVSEQNIEDKLRDLKEVLRDEHHQWFASYLVEERAKLQPNFQQLYLDLLELLGDKTLWAEVLRETYVSAIRLLNAESTLNSSTDRGYLKNLGSWLGSLTIAKDKPIKHKNIYFKELLIEGYDSQRLTVVIPFTCKVLLQAKKSTVFKPPNPWLMDILALLMELYHFAELKLNLKFEIEVLCKDLELDHKTIEPSTCIRDRSAHGEDGTAKVPEGLEGFEDMSLGGINQDIRNERLSPAAIMSSLPSLDKILVFPSSASSMIDPNILRQIVHSAVERAIAEIITPVVERSITIASISTAQLISKDFAMEPDEEKVRHAAGIMVRQLAGSLALVTCKEPLKMSMTNYIRMIQQEYSDQPMPEGLILMCVNDNLDAACGIVQKAAEEKAIPEIEKVLEPQLEARRRHRATRPNEPFIDPSMSRWGLFIPEPYRQMPGGLNKEQLAIYEDFARQPRGPVSNHVQNVSTDSGRQLPDVLQESYPTIPNLSTPAEQPAVPHQTPQAQQDARLQQSTMVGAQPQLNGFLEAQSPRDKVDNLVSELQQAARNASEEHVKDLGRDSPVLQAYTQVLRTILSSPNGEDLARLTSLKICTTLYSQTEGSLEIEVLVHLLAKLCDMSSLVARYTWAILSEVDDEHMFNVPVTVALIDAGLLDLHRVDMILTKLILQKNTSALDLLSNLMDRVLFNDEPSALRSDFSGSLEAMSQWLVEDPSLSKASEIIRKLRESGIPEVVNPLLSDKARSKRDQMEYIFSEWIGIYRFPGATDRTYYTFLKDMHQRQVINNQEDSALFFRLCIDISVAMFEHESQNPNGTLDEAFLYIDALAKLVVLLVKFQGESSGAVKASKSVYLNSILSLLVLVLNHHQVMRGEAFNQRVFFRMFSSILCEYSMNGLHQTDQHQDMMFAFANKFLSLQPKYVPGFVYGWMSLVSHRVFMSGMLNLPEQAGWGPYCEIMQALLSYIGEQLKPANISYVTKDLYKGVLRILLILHHDFPEFVAENHFQFCNVIPAHCAQLRNLVLSAYPSSFHKLPDPFREGLKVERLEEMREAPKIAGDIVAPLQKANIKSVVDNALQSNTISEASVQQICEAVYNPTTKETGLFFTPINVDVILLNALVLYIGQSAVSSVGPRGGTRAAFDNSPHSALLERLAKVLRPEARYYLLSAMANQLRYPNSHTYYFSFTILHLFGVDYSEQQDSDIRQQIIRVLLERLIVHRPHPWGLIITLQELLQNRSYAFFRLPFIQAAPEIGRLFDALLQHIQQQSPRALA